MIQPMMADISSTSSRWWAMTLDGAVQAYQQWAVSSPLEKLRMKIVQSEESKKYPRTEQRAVTMILAAMPEEPRREAIAARKLSVSELLFRLFITYQPGGQKERAALLMELADEKTNNFNGALELLRAIKARAWSSTSRSFGPGECLGEVGGWSRQAWRRTSCLQDCDTS